MRHDQIGSFKVIDYERKKSKGMASVHRLNDAYVLYSKQFDQETGEELGPRAIPIDLQQLKAQRDTLMTQIAALDNLISDIEAL